MTRFLPRSATQTGPKTGRAVLAVMLGLMISLTLGFGQSARAADDGQAALNRATATMEDLRTDSSFGNSRELLRKAKAVLIVPQLVKGGFIFGAEGGNGVMMVKLRDGWSNPAFYGIGAGSFGLQIGLETAELVMFIMNDRAVDELMKSEVKLGVGAGLTVLVVGSSAEAATTAGGADVIAWARAKGAYAGITLSGSVIKPRDKFNASYYGQKLTAREIILEGRGKPIGVGQLKTALNAAESRR